MSKKDLVKKYGFWITLGTVIFAAGVTFDACGRSLLSMDRAVQKKASAEKMTTVEIKLGKLEERVDGMKRRQERMDGKLDLILSRLPKEKQK